MSVQSRTKIFPHFWFAKEAEEAARFYASIFPDSRVDRVSTMQSESPSGPPGSVTASDEIRRGPRLPSPHVLRLRTIRMRRPQAR